MSREGANELVAEVGREAQAGQSAVDAVDEAVAAHFGVNRTDLRCLEVLMAGESTPTKLAAALGLTSGSVTAMLDRLTRLGYVARQPDPSGDRRRVVIRITPEAAERAWQVYGPIATEGAAALDDYTAVELNIVLRFLRQSRELQERHRDRIEALPHHSASGSA